MLLIELNASADKAIFDEIAELHYQAALLDRTYPSINYFIE